MNTPTIDYTTQISNYRSATHHQPCVLPLTLITHRQIKQSFIIIFPNRPTALHCIIAQHPPIHHAPLAVFIGVWVRGLGDCSPPDSGNAIIFRVKAKFLEQKPTAKNERNFFVFIKRKKTELIPSSKIKCPKSWIFSNNYWVGWVRQSIFAS